MTALRYCDKCFDNDENDCGFWDYRDFKEILDIKEIKNIFLVHPFQRTSEERSIDICDSCLIEELDDLLQEKNDSLTKEEKKRVLAYLEKIELKLED